MKGSIGVLSVLLGLLSLGSCTVRPSGVLDPRKMTEVTYDIILADAYLTSHYRPDSQQAFFYESVFDKHKISRALYDSSYVWYAKNPEELNSIYERLNRMYQEKKADLEVAHADSLEESRVRMVRIEDLWLEGDRRREVPAKIRYYAFVHEVVLPDSLRGGDSIAFALRFVPSLEPMDEVYVTYALRSDSLKSTFRRTDTISGGSGTLSRLYSVYHLPDTFPSQPLLNLRVTYRRSPLRVESTSTLLFDSIRLVPLRGGEAPLDSLPPEGEL